EEPVAVHRHREPRGRESLRVPAAEELLDLLDDLLLLARDERDDVVEDVERGHPWVAGPGDRLHRRDDEPVDAEVPVERRDGEGEMDRRAVAVRDDRATPASGR